MSNPTLRKIVLDTFDNRTGMDIGLSILNLARTRNQVIAVQVERLNHIIFMYMDNDLPKDKHLWLKRKSNTAKHFEESTLSVKQDLKEGGMTLSGTFGLDPSMYLAKGGAMPLFVKGAGMVAIVTVSGLRDEEDHQIIVDALADKYIK